MKVEDILTQNLVNQIDHDILIEMFSEAGMSKEDIKEFSDSFWHKADGMMKRKLGEITDADVHMPETDHNPPTPFL